uniref:Uncharacterized protein n=1 Tax=Ditylenchus dipsaci TaxID=166011 RepID=A0A915EIQ9_9BILA
MAGHQTLIIDTLDNAMDVLYVNMAFFDKVKLILVVPPNLVQPAEQDGMVHDGDPCSPTTPFSAMQLFLSRFA